MRKRSYKYAKEKAWEAFSLFIRARDANIDGICRCITCGKYMPWKGTGVCQAGHFISRRYNATLFNEKNVHAQCAGCNKWKYGSEQRYAEELKKRYGNEIVDLLYVSSKQHKKFSVWEFEEIEKHYLEKFNQIKKEKKL